MKKQELANKMVAESGGSLKGGSNNRRHASKVVSIASQRHGFILSRSKREELVLEYRLKARKIARSILRKWRARLDLEEVDSIVDLSLCEAVRRFNPSIGASFVTFLYYHLRGNLIRYVTNSASSQIVPVQEGWSEVKTIGSGTNARVIDAVEISRALCSDEQVQPDEVVFRKEVAKLSRAACARLDVLEREVIFRIFVKGQQLMDIASSLGYSRCHISRVKRRAMEALQDEMTLRLGREDAYTKVELDRKLEVQDSARRQVHRRRPRARQNQETPASTLAAA